MNHRNYKSIVLLLLTTVFFGGCDFYYKNMPFVPIPPQTVSGSITIGSSWMEIVPPKPLKPLGVTNWITLGCKNYKVFDWAENEKNILELADGRNTKIEAYLYDDRGESYLLRIYQTSNGPELHRKELSEIGDGKNNYSTVEFPKDRVYIKLKIRSEIPLECDNIEWQGSKPH